MIRRVSTLLFAFIVVLLATQLIWSATIAMGKTAGFSTKSDCLETEPPAKIPIGTNDVEHSMVNIEKSLTKTQLPKNETGVLFAGYMLKGEVTVYLTFAIQNRGYLEKLITNSHKQTLSEQQFEYAYSPSEGNYLSAISFLQTSHFSIVQTSPNRLMLVAKGSVEDVEKTFNTRIGLFEKGSISFYRSLGEISIPDNLSQIGVSGIEIDNCPMETGANTYIATPSSVIAANMTPDDLRKCYGIYDDVNMGFNGAGTTIGIVEAYGDPDIVTDVDAFNQQYNLPSLSLNIAGTSGTAPPGSNYAIETAMDVEWVHAMAPGAAIRLQLSPDASTGNLYYALNSLISLQSPPNIICLTFRHQENIGDPIFGSGYFVTAAAKGIQVYVATGDDGAYSDASATSISVNYPACDPNVVAVGGTILYYNEVQGTKETYEYGWGGSGGGYSSFFDEPVYQSSAGIPNPVHKRAIPDVSLEANPGVIVWCNGASHSDTGGTSLAASLMAGISAIALNEGINLDNNAFYSLYSSSERYRTAFHDVYISGNNGYYAVGPGWDAVTGLGSINLHNFIGAYLQAGSLKLTSKFLSSSVIQAGQPFTLSYIISNPNSNYNLIQIGLGASIRLHGTTAEIVDSSSDLYISLPGGTSTQSRTFVETASLTPGWYDVNWAVWMGPPGFGNVLSSSGWVSNQLLIQNNPNSNSISVGVNPDSITFGSGTLVIGSVLSGIPGDKSGIVYVQYSTDNLNWITTGQTSSNSSGTYSYWWTPSSAGTFHVRSYWNGNANYAGATSTLTRLTVYLPAGIGEYTMCKAVQWNGQVVDPIIVVIEPTNTFYIDDDKISFLQIMGPIHGNHLVRWDWIAPNGSLYASLNYTIPNSVDYGYSYWTWFKTWYTSGGYQELYAAHLGEPFQTEVYYDGSLVLVETWQVIARPADVFEPDDSFNQYSNMTVTTSLQSQSRSIEPTGDNDYIRFYATPGTCTFYTSSSIDTYGYLYDSNQNQLTYDDDSGGNLQFKIDYTISSSGYYFLRVRGYSSSTEGPYTLYYQLFPPIQITINSDGSVTPSSAPVQRNGNLYTLTADIASSSGIAIERSNIILDGSSHTILGKGTLRGIDAWYQSNLTIRNFNIINFTYGIYLHGTNNTRISGNLISNSSTTGIGVDYSTYNNVYNNVIVYSQFTLWIGWGSNYNSIFSNTLIGCTQHHINVLQSSCNTIFNNTVTLAKWFGIVLDNSSINNIYENTISQNYLGIQATNSSQNTIYHNNFSNNTLQVLSSNSTNFWDNNYPSGGNYWSNYNGTDANHDGIGDTPYTIDANNRDNYPLMKPWPYSPTPTYSLTVVSAHGSPSPSVGTHNYDSGSSVTCSVSSLVTEGGVTYNCTGWTGIGSVPSSGSSVSTTFTITQDSSITWNWAIVPPQVVATPTFSPSPGTYSSAQSVTISCSTVGATIRYTTDGSDPSSSSVVYSGPISVSSGSVTIKARAFASGMTDSDVASATYTIQPQKVATPVISPPSGTYSDSQILTITCSTFATIRYTTDGTDPTSSSPVYMGPDIISASMTVKAKAFRSGMEDSEIATAVYIINPQKVSTPIISPGSGTYSGTVVVSIDCATSGASIRYTTNGVIPTSTSTLYTGPFAVSSTTTVMATAFKTGLTDSDVSSATYTIQPQPIQRSLTVSSAHGSPSPSVGTHSYGSGTSVTCSVTSPVTEGGVTYMCTGWTGAGSVPSSGSGTSTTFTVTQDSRITWNWGVVSTSGIENVVKFDDWKTKGNSRFSIQQNFYVSNSKQRYFVQNVIMFVPIGNVANEYNGYGGFEIYNFTEGRPPQDPLENFIWKLKNKLVFFELTANFVYESTDNEVALRSTIEGNHLVMENDFHERWTWDQNLDSTYYIGKLPEIVIVGTSSNAQVDFEYGTKGYVDTYVRLGGNPQTWFYGENQVVKFSTNTAESSTGLQWSTNGVFQYSDAWTDQGLDFQANIEVPATPPEVQQLAQSGTALVLGMHSPANMSLYDSSGRHVGFNATTGRIDTEIPKSILLFSNHDQHIMVFDPSGPYKLLVTGTDTGDYRLDAYYRGDGDVELLYNSSRAIQKGATSEYTVETSGKKFTMASTLQNQPFFVLVQIVAIGTGVTVLSIIVAVVLMKRRKAKQNSPHIF